MTESGVPDTSESSSKLYLASFPGENPTELEFTTWLNGARDRLRVARLLKYAVSAAPAAPAAPTPGSNFQMTPTAGFPTSFAPSTQATPVPLPDPFVLSPTGAAIGRRV